jgi:cytochrome c oxidase subunit II
MLGLRAAGWSKAVGLAGVALVLAACSGGVAFAIGQPTDGQMGLSDSATEVMSQISSFYDLVNIIIIVIAAFVLALMIWVVARFNEKANPTPSKTTHNVALEVAWTVIPIAILVVIAIPSFKLLNKQYDYPAPDVTIKATGHQWYWEYEYLDQKGMPTIEANMITDEDVLKADLGGDKEFNARFAKLPDGSIERVKAITEAARPIWAKRQAANEGPRQLAVDNEIAVPVGKVVHVLVTADSVIHSWTIPAFGSKMQAVPGRIHATWFKADKKGMYYGQCSVLCGKNHSAMPIAVRVVSPEAYAEWTAALKAKDGKKAKAIMKQAAAELNSSSVAAAQTK